MRSWVPAILLLVTCCFILSCQGPDPVTPPALGYETSLLGDGEILDPAPPGPTPDTSGQSAAGPDTDRERIEICHHTGNGASHRIVISEAALPAHIENHGDHLVGAEECDGIDNDCDGEIDEAGVCECPCDFSLPDPPLPFDDPEWECRHPRGGDPLHARLREKEAPSKALWQVIVGEDPNDPVLHVCSTLTVDYQGNILSVIPVFGLDDGQARGCVDSILDNARTVGIACSPD